MLLPLGEANKAFVESTFYRKLLHYCITLVNDLRYTSSVRCVFGKKNIWKNHMKANCYYCQFLYTERQRRHKLKKIIFFIIFMSCLCYILSFFILNTPRTQSIIKMENHQLRTLVVCKTSKVCVSK